MTENHMESFSYKGKDLAKIIPTIYALANTGSYIYVISPWLNIDVPLIIPWKTTDKEISFINLIELERKRNVNSIFILSTMSREDKETQKSVSELKKRGFSLRVVENLHLKAIIGDVLAYIGSANITYNGIYNNKENVTLRAVNNQDEILRKLLG